MFNFIENLLNFCKTLKAALKIQNNILTGVNIIPFSIPFGIVKFERNGGKFFNWGYFYLIGGIFLNWGQMEANVLVEFEIFF